jgi:hypothetical protein
MAQAVSYWSLTAEARFHVQVSPCGICGGQSGPRTGLSPSSLVFPCQYHSTMSLHTYKSYIIWVMNNRPVDGYSSEKQSHPFDMNMNGDVLEYA